METWMHAREELAQKTAGDEETVIIALGLAAAMMASMENSANSPSVRCKLKQIALGEGNATATMDSASATRDTRESFA
jgi:hypothetical protein